MPAGGVADMAVCRSARVCGGRSGELMPTKTQTCPICQRRVPPVERYPRYLCEGCASEARCRDGRPLAFSNVGIWGGFRAAYADTGEPYEDHLCFVRGIRCWADEARFGGIVIQALLPGQEGPPR